MPLLNELKISKDLIRYQTITPKDNGIMKYISKKLRSLGFKCKLLKFSDKKKSSAPILNLYARREEIKDQIFVMQDILTLFLLETIKIGLLTLSHLQ